MVIRGSASEIFVGGEWDSRVLTARSFNPCRPHARKLSVASAESSTRQRGHLVERQSRRGAHVVGRLSDAYNHPLEKLRYDLFDVRDGLPGYAQQGENASAVAAADGRLWFATNHGIAWIDPDHLIRNAIPPNVVIRSVVADQRTYQSAGPIELPESTRSVRFDYTALSLGEPDRVRFRYQLQGADDTWRDAGNERSVRYANLRPGHYTFRVIASNSDGVWNEVGATTAFALRPAFYQTFWFLVLESGACIGFLGSFYWLACARSPAGNASASSSEWKAA